MSTPISRSMASAASRQRSSLSREEMTWTPVGSPPITPVGTHAAGSPMRLAGSTKRNSSRPGRVLATGDVPPEREGFLGPGRAHDQRILLEEAADVLRDPVPRLVHQRQRRRRRLGQVVGGQVQEALAVSTHEDVQQGSHLVEAGVDEFRPGDVRVHDFGWLDLVDLVALGLERPTGDAHALGDVGVRRAAGGFGTRATFRGRGAPSRGASTACGSRGSEPITTRNARRH